MVAFVTLNSVSAATPDAQPLFAGLSLSFGAERVGIVGRNGAGKSTLLRIIAGEIEPAGGSLTRCGTVGKLDQDWPGHITVAQALGVADALLTVRRVLAGRASGDDLASVDWTLEERVDAALRQVGLLELSLERVMATLSGGEQTRIGLARAIVEEPNLLLLDEPSNNLDEAGRAAIRDLIRDWRGGVVVASHDRTLLADMDRIVELTPIAVRVVGGGWNNFVTLREGERDRAAAEMSRAADDLREVRRDVQRQREAKDRRDKAGRSFAAKGSEPRILLGARAERAENSGSRSRRVSERLINDAAARVELARGRVEVLTPLAMTLPSTGLAAGQTLLALTDVTITAGERTLGPWNLEVRGPERIRISGGNGVGKTSLLRCAVGSIAPVSGTVWRVPERIVFLDQHVRTLDRQVSILDNFRRLNPGLSEREAHAACARFAFRNEHARQQVGTLSGGELLRAGLACTLSGDRPPWLLVLDEPTNHLDIEAVEILEQALSGFDGAILIVSHDRAFLQAIRIEREMLLDSAQR